VSGDHDSYSPAKEVRALKDKIGAPARVEILSGADHFFGGMEGELSIVIGEALETG
jgi:hypothetical protein